MGFSITNHCRFCEIFETASEKLHGIFLPNRDGGSRGGWCQRQHSFVIFWCKHPTFIWFIWRQDLHDNYCHWTLKNPTPLNLLRKIAMWAPPVSSAETFVFGMSETVVFGMSETIVFGMSEAIVFGMSETPNIFTCGMMEDGNVLIEICNFSWLYLTTNSLVDWTLWRGSAMFNFETFKPPSTHFGHLLFCAPPYASYSLFRISNNIRFPIYVSNWHLLNMELSWNMINLSK